jgi:hypothetical protein
VNVRKVSDASRDSAPVTAGSPWRGRLQALSAAIGFSALAVAFWWPLPAAPATTTTADLFGDPLLNAWTLAWGADRLPHGLNGFWTGLYFFPYPDTVAYSEHLLGITIFTAPLQWLSGNPILAYNAASIATTALAGFGAWLLARELTGRADAAVLAGVAFACSPYRVPHIYHLQVLMSGWMPLGLWGLHRFLSTGSRRALGAFAACYVLQACSNGYFLYFMAVPATIVAVHGLWHRRAARARTAASLAVAAAVILAALAPVASGYLRVRRDQGLRRSFGDIVQFSPDLMGYAHVNERLLFWGRVLSHGPYEREVFPGLMVTALAVTALGIGVRRRAPGALGSSVSPERSIPLYTVVLVAALILSLGPIPRVGGHTLPFPGPYAWLLPLVPGLDGLRVPARLAVVVHLALAVLGTCGLGLLTAGMRHTWRRALVTGCVCVVIAEGYPGLVAVERFPTSDMVAERPAYEWLRKQRGGAALELPVGTTPTAARYVYNTLLHGHRIVNGYSGYGSALQDFVGGPPFTEVARFDDALRMARALGLRWIVVHPSLYNVPASGEAIILALRAATTHVARVMTFDAAAVVELKPTAPPPLLSIDPMWRELHAGAFTASASHNVGAIGRAFDGDRGTRWLTGERQQGREWIELRFGGSLNVARVRLEMDRRSQADYPRGLIIEGSDDGGAWHTLFEGGILPRLGVSIAREPRTPGIDIVLPPNTTRTLRLRTIGETRVWYWSVHELRVWTR